MNTKWLEFEFIFLHKRKKEIRDKAHLKEFLEYMCKKHSKAKYNLPLKMGLEYSLLFNLMSPCGTKNLYIFFQIANYILRARKTVIEFLFLSCIKSM